MNGISIMLSFYAFRSGGRGSRQDQNKKKKGSKSGLFPQDGRDPSAPPKQWAMKSLKRREQGSEDLDTTKKKEIDKQTPVSKNSKNRGISLRFKESRHVAKQQFEKDKLNGEERKKREKKNKAKP